MRRDSLHRDVGVSVDGDMLLTATDQHAARAAVMIHQSGVVGCGAGCRVMEVLHSRVGVGVQIRASEGEDIVQSCRCQMMGQRAVVGSHSRAAQVVQGSHVVGGQRMPVVLGQRL